MDTNNIIIKLLAIFDTFHDFDNCLYINEFRNYYISHKLIEYDLTNIIMDKYNDLLFKDAVISVNGIKKQIQELFLNQSL
jgi:hypothetical protein